MFSTFNELDFLKRNKQSLSVYRLCYDVTWTFSVVHPVVELYSTVEMKDLDDVPENYSDSVVPKIDHTLRTKSHT